MKSLPNACGTYLWKQDVKSAPPAPGSTIVAPVLLQIGDRAIDDADDLFVPLGEQALVHELADDADADAVEPVGRA